MTWWPPFFVDTLEAVCHGLQPGLQLQPAGVERRSAVIGHGAAHRRAVALDQIGFSILAALDEVSARYSSTPARVAIAWLLARPSVTAPIASATSLEQLDDLIEATRLKLDGPAVELLDTASASS